MLTYKGKLQIKMLNRKRIVIALSIVLIAGVSLLALEKTGITNFYSAEPYQNNDIAELNPESQTTSEDKIDMSPAKPSDNDAINKFKESDPSTVQQTTNSSISVIITRAGVVNNVLQIRSMINGASEGSCNLTLTAGSSVVQKSNSIITLVDGSRSCQFDVNSSELSTGKWLAVIEVSSGNKSAKSEPRDIEVK